MSTSPIVGIRNFRSLSSVGPINGKHIIPNRFFRCASLYHAPKESLDSLYKDYNVRLIIDLRTPREANRAKDPDIEGVRHLLLPVMEELDNGIIKGDDNASWFERVRNYRELGDTYTFLGKSAYCLRQLGIILKECLNLQEGAVLFHCSAGKDRTGIVAYLLLFLFGCPIKQIYRDYLASNKGARRFARKRAFECWQTTHELALSKKVYRNCICKKKYLDNFMHGLMETCGSLDNIYKDYCGFTQEDIEDYKQRLLI